MIFLALVHLIGLLCPGSKTLGTQLFERCLGRAKLRLASVSRNNMIMICRMLDFMFCCMLYVIYECYAESGVYLRNIFSGYYKCSLVSPAISLVKSAAYPNSFPEIQMYSFFCCLLLT